jgi:hypothetical protein
MLDSDEQTAMNVLSDALAAGPEGWQARSTLGTLRRLRKAREARGRLPAWMTEVERALEEAS